MRADLQGWLARLTVGTLALRSLPSLISPPQVSNHNTAKTLELWPARAFCRDEMIMLMEQGYRLTKAAATCWVKSGQTFAQAKRKGGAIDLMGASVLKKKKTVLAEAN